ncbi:hypothetical protein [Streptomyces sp. NPDC001530]|uniref:hypothetical protein n=1 Tax=Streptomyces sp. NPDC001530 TaxID=3364582 RepID=UPI00368B52AA
MAPDLAEFGEAVQLPGDDVAQREDVRVAADAVHPGAGRGDQGFAEVVRVGEVVDGGHQGAAERCVE